MGYCPFEYKAGRWARRRTGWARKQGRAGRARCRGSLGTGERGEQARGAQARGTARTRRCDKATARAWACLCAPGRAAGPAGCALGAPSLFFDSVLFLSHRLDKVREHCSSPNFFEKKSNKNETKFWNNEIFKNKIFDVKKRNDLTCGN